MTGYDIQLFWAIKNILGQNEAYKLKMSSLHFIWKKL